MGHPAAAGDPMSLAGQRLGRYEVLTQLASGGMATVYIARAQGVAGFERLVAVKVMHPHLAHEEEFISMFLDEARLAARIRHPNVVPTLDISDTDGRGFYLVMDYVEGDHLGALLRGAVVKRELLDARVAVRVVMDALAGLVAAHTLIDDQGNELRLVHRDISPHNILVGADGVSRLTDFGVAKAEVRLSSTRDGQFKGKLGYMAPEHASTGLADQRSDIFSMGIVLWECLASKRLFRGENNAATLSKILNMPVPPLAEISPSLAPFDPVLAKALAKEPDERYQSANDFLVAIEEACATGQVQPASPRIVAAAVREHAGEKLDAERARIKEAIDTYGASSLAEVPLPRPSDGSASAKYRKDAVDSGQDVVTMAASPVSLRPGTEDGGQKRGVLGPILAVVALLALAGGGAAYYFSTQGTEEAEEPGLRIQVIEGREPTGTAPGPAAAAPDPAPVADPVEPGPEPDPLPEEEELATEEEPESARSMMRRRPASMMRGMAGAEATAAPAMDTEATPPPAMMRRDDLLENPYTQ